MGTIRSYLGILNFRWKVAMVLFIIFLLFIGSFTSFIHSLITKHDTESMRANLLELTKVSVAMLDINAYKKIISLIEWKKISLTEKEAIALMPEYRKIQQQLEYIRNSDSTLIGSVYTMIPTSDKNRTQFIVDVDTTPENIEQARGRKDFEDYMVFPGNYYDISDQPTTIRAVSEKVNIVDTQIRYDPTWDKYSLMGYAPIFDPETSKYLGVLGIDLYDSDIDKKNESIHLALNIATVVIVILALIVIFFFTKNILHVKRLTEAHETLEKSYAQLRLLDDRKTEFLNIASHELRTPMTSVKWYASMLLDGDAGTLPDAALEYIAVIYNQSKRLVRLINDMLDISKMESGRDDEFILLPIQVMRFFREIHDDFIPIAKEKELILEWFMCIKEDMKILLPSDRFRQAIINLLSNAVKFTPEQGTVRLTLQQIQNDLIIEISDTGIGIAQEHFDLIFEKFWQAKSSLRKDTEGTGLWLPIVKTIIEKMGGSITLASTVWKGSIFTVKIPIIKEKTHEKSR